MEREVWWEKMVNMEHDKIHASPGNKKNLMTNHFISITYIKMNFEKGFSIVIIGKIFTMNLKQKLEEKVKYFSRLGTLAVNFADERERRLAVAES